MYVWPEDATNALLVNAFMSNRSKPGKNAFLIQSSNFLRLQGSVRLLSFKGYQSCNITIFLSFTQIWQ